MKDIFDEILKEDAVKYLNLVSDYFLLGFLILFSGFKNRFYNIDFFLLITICISISSVFFIYFSFISKLLWSVTKTIDEISNLKYPIFNMEYEIEHGPEDKRYDLELELETIKLRIEYLKSPNEYRRYITNTYNLVLAFLIGLSILFKLVAKGIFDSSIEPRVLVIFLFSSIIVIPLLVAFIMRRRIRNLEKIEFHWPYSQ